MEKCTRLRLTVCTVLSLIIVNCNSGSIASVYAARDYAFREEYEEAKEQAEADSDVASKLIEEVLELNEKMIEEAELIEKTHKELYDIDDRIKESENKLKEYEESGEIAREYLYNNIVMDYEAGYRKGLLDYCLMSDSVMDILNRIEYSRAVNEYIDNRIISAEWMTKQINKERNSLNEMKTAKQDQLESYERQRTEFADEIDKLSELMENAKDNAESSKKFAEEMEKRVAEMAEREKELLKQAQYSDNSGQVTYSGNGTDYYYEAPYDYTDAELKLMAGIIQAEAGSTSYPGMVAVGSVVMNRVKSPDFANTIEGVIYAKSQFEPVSTGRLAVILAEGPVSSCYGAAKDVLEGKRNVHNYYFKASWYAKEHGINGIEIGGNVFH